MWMVVYNDDYRYIVKEMLGSGTFGQVVKCRVVETGQLVSVKIIKNKPAYLKQSQIEVDILKHASFSSNRIECLTTYIFLHSLIADGIRMMSIIF